MLVAHKDAVVCVQGQADDMAVQLNEEEQLLVITRLHQVLASCNVDVRMSLKEGYNDHPAMPSCRSYFDLKIQQSEPPGGAGAAAVHVAAHEAGGGDGAARQDGAHPALRPVRLAAGLVPPDRRGGALAHIPVDM